MKAPSKWLSLLALSLAVFTAHVFAADPLKPPKVAAPAQAEAAVQAPAPVPQHGRGYVPPPNLEQLKRDSFQRHGARLKALAAKAVPATFLSPYLIPQQDQGQCHPPGTKILMADGTQRRIEFIQKGDQVRGMDGTPRTVLAVTMRRRSLELCELITRDFIAVLASSEHPILTDAGDVPIGELKPGMKIRVFDAGEYSPVSEVTNYGLKELDWYGIDVDGDQHYVADGIVCHNCGDCWCVSANICGAMAVIAAGQAPNDGKLSLASNYTMWCFNNGGCNGDDASTVFGIMKKTGIPTEAQFGAYQPTDRGRCPSISSMKLYQASDWGYADSNGDGRTSFDEYCSAVVQFGSVVLTNDANALGNGTSIETSRGGGTDHQIIGVGFNRNYSDPSRRVVGLVLAKNQWGNWGSSLGDALKLGQFPADTVIPPGVTANDMGYVLVAAFSDGTMGASFSSEVLWVEVGSGPVPPTPPGVTASLVANPPAIDPGQASTLTWATTNATAATLSGVGAVSLSGSLNVSPTVATVYTFTASGAAGTATSVASIIPNGPPTPPPPPPAPPGPPAPATPTSPVVWVTLERDPNGLVTADLSKSINCDFTTLLVAVPDDVAATYRRMQGIDPKQIWFNPKVTNAPAFECVARGKTTDGTQEDLRFFKLPAAPAPTLPAAQPCPCDRPVTRTDIPKPVAPRPALMTRQELRDYAAQLASEADGHTVSLIIDDLVRAGHGQEPTSVKTVPAAFSKSVERQPEPVEPAKAAPAPKPLAKPVTVRTETRTAPKPAAKYQQPQRRRRLFGSIDHHAASSLLVA